MLMNNEKVSKARVGQHALAVILPVLVITLLVSGGRWALAQEGVWATPTVVSAPPGFSWFPDLAVDAFGSVHLVWCKSTPLEKEIGGVKDQVQYAYWHGGSWTKPNDIVPPSADIVRNAIATDLEGNVHLIFGGSVYNRNFGLYHRKAAPSEAWSAAAWSTPHLINQGASYMGDMAVDSQGVIHVIYDDSILYTGEDFPAIADIFYRRSTDGGYTWSAPVNLDPGLRTGSARPYIEVDSGDVVHVTWDEGWDRLTGKMSDTAYSIYTFSSDRGETWASPTVIDYPDAMTAQLTVGGDGQGGVMLVWRSTARDEIFYQWSTDGGQSWNAPAVIPWIFARPWTIPFDMYDMAADSAGQIHLLVVGRMSQAQEALLGVYHLVWDGSGWSAPTRIFAATGLYPEYPKIVVHEGNQLHVAWFTREGSVWDQEVNREVWYTSSQSPAPHQPVTPMPTSTPVPPTPTFPPTPTITPYPTVSLEGTGLPDGLRTETDDVIRLAVALSPVALVILVVIAARVGWRSRLR
jgi:hypothetical protein